MAGLETRHVSVLTPAVLAGLSTDLLVANGADQGEARSVAAALVWADTVGRHTQGVSRLEILVSRLRNKLIRSPCQAQIDRRRPGIIQIAGRGGFGHYLGVLGMQQAMAAASEQGVAMCSVADSNYFGAAGYYANLAAEAGMIGLAASNSFAKVAAHGGTRAVLGTNPWPSESRGPTGATCCWTWPLPLPPVPPFASCKARV